MRLIKNKKAGSGEEWLSPWMFVIWIIIGAGVVLGVYIFFSGHADTRQKEAEILAFQVQDCLEKQTLPLSDNFNFLETCKLNKKLIEESEKYYIKIEITDSQGKSRVFEYGVHNFETLCELNEKSSDFPRCEEKEINIDNNKIKILTASNYKGERV